DARTRYLDRQSEASTESESRSLTGRYHSNLLRIVTGSLHEGLRSLGQGFDDRLMQARRSLKLKLSRQRGMGCTEDATRAYREDVVRIVLDAMAAEAEAERIVAD